MNFFGASWGAGFPASWLPDFPAPLAPPRLFGGLGGLTGQSVEPVQQRGTLLVGHVLRDGECRVLFRLLFRVAGSVSDLHVVDQHRTVKYRMVGR